MLPVPKVWNLMAAEGSRGQPRLLCVPSIFDGDHLTNAAVARKKSVELQSPDLDSVEPHATRRSTELIGIESDGRMVSSVCPQGTTLHGGWNAEMHVRGSRPPGQSSPHAHPHQGCLNYSKVADPTVT